MTQEDKELLLKDLSARLPYGVIVLEDIDKTFDGGCVSELVTITEIKGEKMFLTKNSLTPVTIEEIRPYLRPMSSMTEKEKRHISKMMCLRTYDDGVVHDMTYPVYTPYYVMEDCLSYLRSIHVDYSGLIEKDLALVAPEGMYDLKEK